MKAYKTMCLELLNSEKEFCIRFPELEKAAHEDLKRAKSNIRFFKKVLKARGIEYKYNNNSSGILIDAVKYEIDIWVEASHYFGFVIYSKKKEMWKLYLEIFVDDKREIHLIGEQV